jgi:hypothetical protein
LEGLGIENIVIFYDHLEYFMAIGHNVWQFGIVCGHLVYVILPFWYVRTKKNMSTIGVMKLCKYNIKNVFVQRVKWSIVK